MKMTAFQVDFNSYGFAQIETPEAWSEFVAQAKAAAEQHGGPVGSDGTVLSYLLEAPVAGPRDVALTQATAKLHAAPGSLGTHIGYGIRGDRPSFGYRIEHRGAYTLEQWALALGMDLRTAGSAP